MTTEIPIYSHNPYYGNRFPLLVLDVHGHQCFPFNEGFRALHWHEELQFVYILKGTVHFKIYDEEFNLSEQDCLFINRAVMHHITEKENCHYHSYIIPAQMLSFFSGSIMEQSDVGAIINNPGLTHYPLISDNPSHTSILQKIQQLDTLYFGNRKENHLEYRLSIQLCNIWLELLSLLPNINQTIPQKGYERIRCLISFIHTNYMHSISLDDIASSANISQTECLRCFQQFVRCSPYQYLLQYRLHKSIALLTTTNTTITNIALNIGFRSASSYIKYFKMHYQVTPFQYRQSNKQSTYI